MACLSPAPGVVVCGVVTDDQLRRRILWCPFEQRHQEMVVRFETWYDPTLFCCGCGDSWTGSWMTPRPWKRNWRPENVRRYRSLWDRATYGPPPLPDVSWVDS